MPDVTQALRELEREILPFRRIIAAIDELKLKAFRDELTPLGNARAMRQAFEDAIATDVPHFVAFGDLTGFKAVNDTYGHDAGDAVIRAFGKWLHGIAQQHLIGAFRKSGDEFVLLGTMDRLEPVSEALRGAIPPVRFDGNTIAVEASFGTAELDFAPERAMKNAETACLCAKQRGVKLFAWDGTEPTRTEQRWRCGLCHANIRVECEAGRKLNCPACGCSKG